MMDRLTKTPAARAAANPPADPPPLPDINARIAAHVHALRSAQGLSLDALAGRSDVSRSALSLLERGETSPTAVVLEKIASALGVSLATLFEDPGAPPGPVVRAAERTPWRDPQSGYVRTNISPPNYPSPLQIVAVELPAGAYVAYESTPRDIGVHQQIWVRSGRIDVTLGAHTWRLAEDDCLAMRLDVPTSFRNRTRESAHYVVVLASQEARAAPRSRPGGP